MDNYYINPQGMVVEYMDDNTKKLNELYAQLEILKIKFKKVIMAARIYQKMIKAIKAEIKKLKDGG
uniref:Uncharacterized protein n=1 Tax=viral metagenome TaxID=1070528 RepID=A0A6M3KQQ0_9ZZZZ